MICSSCKTTVQAIANFCHNCGQKIEKSQPVVVPGAENRHTAVMFSDLADSTRLAERLGAEDYHWVVQSYYNVVSNAVNRFDGHVAKYLGDGVMAFFGFPVAHEDDTARAFLAALNIIELIGKLNEDLQARFGIEIAVRIGIHSGAVVAGEMGSKDNRMIDIVGEAPNIAARMQEVAAPNTVVATEDAYRLTSNLFRVEFLGQKRLKGVTRLISVFRILSMAEAQYIERHVIGRGEELDLLSNLWDKSVGGTGQLAVVVGEAGIGKSALVSEAVNRFVQAEPSSRLIWIRCSPYHQNTPFFPIIEYLRTDVLQVSRRDEPDLQLERLRLALEERGLPVADTIPILAPLLSIPIGEGYAEPLLSSEGRRIRTMEVMLQLASRGASSRPLILILDNAHWADPSTLEAFGKIVETLSRLRIIALVTSRPDNKPSFPARANATELNLDRLDHQASWSLARQVAGGLDLPFEILDYVISKTDGVPLFVEELTKTILESDAVRIEGERYVLVGDLKELSIPTTLQGSLVARLERAAGRKDIAQVAAVIGREFNTGVIASVVKIDEEEVAKQLAFLVDADLVYRVQAFSGRATYRFRHALIQDAAYDSLLKSVRQQYHVEIAKSLESDYSEEQPEVIANHYSAAGAVEAALRWWPRAGQKALSRSANVEAITHFTAGLELLEQLAEGPEKIQMELAMLAQRGMALIATKGFAAPEVGETFRRAEQICQIIGETPLLFPVIWGLWVYSLVRSELEVSCEHAEQMLRLSQVAEDVGMEIEGHFTLGDSLFWLGRLSEAKGHLDRAIQIYDPVLHQSNILHFGQDPGVTTLCYLAYVYWAYGYPDQALEFANRANEVAVQTRHPFSIGWGLAFASSIRNWRGEFESARVLAQQSREYCSEQGQAFWASASVASLGWATYYSQDPKRGIELLREGLTGYDLTGSIVVGPLWRAILAEVLLHHGDFVASLEICDDGLAMVARHHEWVTEPYLRRVRGEALAKLGRVQEGLEEIQRAFEQAESQHSKMRALQAAVAWAKLDPSATNFDRLEATYRWFTEGFGTRDLTDARELLQSAGRLT